MTSVWKRLQRTGKRASRFQFVASYQELILECTQKWQPDKIVIVWTRRNRRVCSKAHSWQPGIKDPFRGSVVWAVPENVDITATLYRDPHSDHFEEKEWTFQVEGESRGHKKLLAVAPIDLRKFAAINSAPREVRLPLTPRSVKVVSAALTVSITCTLLREGKATDDDMQSIASLLSLKPSDIADLDDFNDEEEEDKLQRQNRSSVGSAPREPLRELSTLAEEDDETSLSTTKKESVKLETDDKHSHHSNERAKRLSRRSLESEARMTAVPSQDQRLNEVWKIREVTPDNKPLLSDRAMEQPESAPRDMCRESLEEMVSETSVLPEDAAIKKRGHTIIVTGDDTEVKIPPIPCIPKRAKAEREQVVNKPVEIAPGPAQFSYKEATLGDLPQRTSVSKDVTFPEKVLYAEKTPDKTSEILEIKVRSAEKDVKMTTPSGVSAKAIGDVQKSPKANDFAVAQNTCREGLVTVVDRGALTQPASAGAENLQISDNLNQMPENVQDKTYTKVQESSYDDRGLGALREHRLVETEGVEEIEGEEREGNLENQFVLQTTKNESKISDSQEAIVHRGQETKAEFLEKIHEAVKEREVIVSEPESILSVGEILKGMMYVKDTVPEDTFCTVDASLQDTIECDTDVEKDSNTNNTILENLQDQERIDSSEFEKEVSLLVSETEHTQDSLGWVEHAQDTLGETEHMQDTVSGTEHLQDALGEIKDTQDTLDETKHTQDTLDDQLSTQQPVPLAEKTKRDMPGQKYNKDQVQENNEKRQNGAVTTVDIEKETWIKESTNRSETRVSEPERVEEKMTQLDERLYQVTDKDKDLQDMTETTGDKGPGSYITHCLIQCTQREISRDNQDGADKAEDTMRRDEYEIAVESDGIQTFEKHTAEKSTIDVVESRLQEKEKELITKSQYVIILESPEMAVNVKKLDPEEVGIQGDFILEENKVSEIEIAPEINVDRVTCEQMRNLSEDILMSEKYQYPDDNSEVRSSNDPNKVRETHMLTNERPEEETLKDEKENQPLLENISRSEEAVNLISRKELYIQSCGWLDEEASSARKSISQEDSLDIEIINLPSEGEGYTETKGKDNLLEKCLLTSSSVSTHGDRIGKETARKVNEEEETLRAVMIEKTDIVEKVLDKKKKKDPWSWASSRSDVGESTEVKAEEETSGSKDVADQEDVNTYLLIDGSLNVEEVYLGTTKNEPADIVKQVFAHEKEKDSFFWTNNSQDLKASSERMDQKTSIWEIEKLEDETGTSNELPDQENLSTCLLIDESLNVEEIYLGTTEIGKTDISEQAVDQEKQEYSGLQTNDRLDFLALTNEETMDRKDEVSTTSIWEIERLEEVLGQEDLNTCLLVDRNLNIEEVYLGATIIEKTDLDEQVLDKKNDDSCLWENTSLTVEAPSNKEAMDIKDKIYNKGIHTSERLVEEANELIEVPDREDLNTCSLIDGSLNVEAVDLGTTKIEKTGLVMQELDHEKEPCFRTDIRLVVNPLNQKYEGHNTGTHIIKTLENKATEVDDQEDLKTCLSIDGSLKVEPVIIENPQSQDDEAEETWFWANEELHEAGEHDRGIENNSDGQKSGQQESEEGNIEVRDGIDDSAFVVALDGTLQDTEKSLEEQIKKNTIESRINTANTEQVIQSVQGSSFKELEAEKKVNEEETTKTNENIIKTAEPPLDMKGEEGTVVEEMSTEGKKEEVPTSVQDTSAVMQHKVLEITNAQNKRSVEQVDFKVSEQTSSLRSGNVELDIKDLKKSEKVQESTAASEDRTFKGDVSREAFKEPVSEETQHFRTEKVVEMSSSSKDFLQNHAKTLQGYHFPQEIKVEGQKQLDLGGQDIENVLEDNNELSRKDIDSLDQEFHPTFAPRETYSIDNSSPGAEESKAHLLSECTLPISSPQTLGQQWSKEKKRLSQSTGQVGEVGDSL